MFDQESVFPIVCRIHQFSIVLLHMLLWLLIIALCYTYIKRYRRKNYTSSKHTEKKQEDEKV